MLTTRMVKIDKYMALLMYTYTIYIVPEIRLYMLYINTCRNWPVASNSNGSRDDGQNSILQLDRSIGIIYIYLFVYKYVCICIT